MPGPAQRQLLYSLFYRPVSRSLAERGGKRIICFQERKATKTAEGVNAVSTYKDAGVDIAAGSEAVRLMQSHVRSTFRPEVLQDIGGFGGLFALGDRYRDAVLVAGADGVGTKLKVAFMLDRHDTVGIDAVAMCVNDIIVSGAEPLFSLIIWPQAKLSRQRWRKLSAGWRKAAAVRAVL